MSEILSCYDCLDPEATPLSDQMLEIYVHNEFCSDTARIDIAVDDERRIFFPNVFNPEGDPFNNTFYFQSPDPAKVISFQVYDRWGNLLYQSKGLQTNEKDSGWNGRSNGALMPPGVYIWSAEIGFYDGESEIFAGDVTIIY